MDGAALFTEAEHLVRTIAQAGCSEYKGYLLKSDLLTEFMRAEFRHNPDSKVLLSGELVRNTSLIHFSSQFLALSLSEQKRLLRLELLRLSCERV